MPYEAQEVRAFGLFLMDMVKLIPRRRCATLINEHSTPGAEDSPCLMLLPAPIKTADGAHVCPTSMIIHVAGHH